MMKNLQDVFLTWPGKQDILKIAENSQPGKIIKESGIEITENDFSNNLIINGDNLPVMQWLQNTNSSKIKLVYIDPPYNTGKTFTYIDKNNHKVKRISAKADWLNMMTPRLSIIRNLLTDDGYLVCHIDEYENEYAKVLLDEIFGGENYVGTIVWDKLNPKGDAKGIASQNEFIIIYAKNWSIAKVSNPPRKDKPFADTMVSKGISLQNNSVNLSATILTKQFQEWLKKQDQISKNGLLAYNKVDAAGRVYRLVHMGWPNKKTPPFDYFVPLVHPVTNIACPVPARGWRYPTKTMQRMLQEGKILFGKDEKVQPQQIYYLDEYMSEPVASIMRDGSSDDQLFSNLGIKFEHPKPYHMAANLISWFSHGDNDIVLDCFAGSGTTGHAVLEANQKDGSHRLFWLIQNSDKAQGQNATRTIFEICLSRLEKIANNYISKPTWIVGIWQPSSIK